MHEITLLLLRCHMNECIEQVAQNSTIEVKRSILHAVYPHLEDK